MNLDTFTIVPADHRIASSGARLAFPMWIVLIKVSITVFQATMTAEFSNIREDNAVSSLILIIEKYRKSRRRTLADENVRKKNIRYCDEALQHALIGGGVGTFFLHITAK